MEKSRKEGENQAGAREKGERQKRKTLGRLNSLDRYYLLILLRYRLISIGRIGISRSFKTLLTGKLDNVVCMIFRAF
jgi:hypothetical protein